MSIGTMVIGLCEFREKEAELEEHEENYSCMVMVFQGNILVLTCTVL